MNRTSTVNRAANSATWKRLLLFLCIGIAGGIFLAGRADQTARAQEGNGVGPGQSVSGSVRSAGGDEWTLWACAGSTMTVTMQSSAFTPYLEIYAPDGEDPLAEGAGARDEIVLTDVPFAETGPYTIIAAGARRRDRGAYTLSVQASGATKAEEEELAYVNGVLAPSQAVSGRIPRRGSAEWAFYGCKGDQVTLRGASDEFDVYMELFRSGAEDILASDENRRAGGAAEIANFTLPATGNYIVLIAGATRQDRGAYSLSLDMAVDGEPNAKISRTPTRTPTRTWRATRTRTPTRTRRATRTPTSTATPRAGTCTVRSARLNLRSGPGIAYSPPIGSLRQGNTLRMLGRNRSSTWIQVEVTATGARGWVSGGSQYVTCNRGISGLPLGEIPPTPTPTRTPTPRPTATPTPTEKVVVLPTPPSEVGIGGGPSQGLKGTLMADRNMFSGPSDNPTFRNRMYFRVLVWDPNKGHRDGDGISHVVFEIQENFGQRRLVHRQRENFAGYCSFGGGEPNCNVLTLRPGVKWPKTPNGQQIAIQNGEYNLTADVYKKGDDDPFTWNVDFKVSLSSGGTGGGGNSGGGSFPLVLYDNNPRNSSPKLCSGFKSECNFANCPRDHRLVYGPFCRGSDYPYIFPGLYKVELSGSGRVRAGATDWGSTRQLFALGDYLVNLPAQYTFCWPGRAPDGYGFEIIVRSLGERASVDRIKLTYLSDRC